MCGAGPIVSMPEASQCIQAAAGRQSPAMRISGSHTKPQRGPSREDNVAPLTRAWINYGSKRGHTFITGFRFLAFFVTMHRRKWVAGDGSGRGWAARPPPSLYGVNLAILGQTALTTILHSSLEPVRQSVPHVGRSIVSQHDGRGRGHCKRHCGRRAGC